MAGETAGVARETAGAVAEIDEVSGGHHPLARCPHGVDSKTVEDFAPSVESGCPSSAR